MELAPSSFSQPFTTTQKGEALQDQEVAIVAVLADGEAGVEVSSIGSKDTVVIYTFFSASSPFFYLFLGEIMVPTSERKRHNVCC